MYHTSKREILGDTPTCASLFLTYPGALSLSHDRCRVRKQASPAPHRFATLRSLPSARSITRAAPFSTTTTLRLTRFSQSKGKVRSLLHFSRQASAGAGTSWWWIGYERESAGWGAGSKALLSLLSARGRWHPLANAIQVLLNLNLQFQVLIYVEPSKPAPLLVCAERELVGGDNPERRAARPKQRSALSVFSWRKPICS